MGILPLLNTDSLVCLISTKHRLSDGVHHINAHAHNITIEMLFLAQYDLRRTKWDVSWWIYSPK